jgi:hypothetical protein
MEIPDTAHNSTVPIQRGTSGGQVLALNRYDETWHRLREWTKGQTPSERLAAQLLIHEGFANLDPSHPLGGRDGGRDAIATKEGKRFAMAVYFPRGQQAFNAIRTKFEGDLGGAKRNSADGIAFVTNQEFALSEREDIKMLAASTVVDLFHLERIATILDSPDMAKVREQFLDIEVDSSPAIHLGGQGGAALGSGGGGGGAIGPKATGGSGGTGGDINLHGTSGEGPGAGGGGAGAVGEGAIGGEGGGGGEYVSGTLGPDEIGLGSGFHHFEIQVGKGGVGGPGEDSILNLCDENGHVLQSIVAKGGRAGAPPRVPPPSRSPTDKDIRLKDGLWTVIDGGWDWLQIGTNPFRVPLPLLVEIETGTIEPGTILDLKLVGRSPDSFLVYEQRQAVTVQDSLVRRSRFVVTLEFSGARSGLWRVQVLAGRQMIGEFPIEIRTPAHE